MERELEQRACNLVKIVFYGPESTGKTTLAQKLAEYFNTVWVPEFSRDYLQEKWDRERTVCTREDILPIARGQMALENRLCTKATQVLFCDTNLLETAVYSEAYFDGFCEPSLLKHALKAHYDLYFLTYIDTPWVADDLRDRPDQRDLMFAKFKAPLDEYNLPYHILRGNLQERFDEAVEKVEKLLKNRQIELNRKRHFSDQKKRNNS